MIPTDENGYVLLPGDSRSYARNAGGWIEAMVRADDVATWEAAAEARHLLIRTTLDDGAEVVGPAPHVHIDGPMYPTLTPATFDEEGNVLTPATLDTRPHYNLRIAPWAQEALADDGVTPRWYETLTMFMSGTPITEADKNKAEDGVYTSGITVIDPETVASKMRVFA